MREDRGHLFVVHRRLEVMSTPEFVLSDGQRLQCALAAEMLRSSGILRLRVAGWSMVPTLWLGDTLVIEAADSGTVSSGDIVLFSRHGKFVAHRVVAKASPGCGIQTRGDALPRMDATVSNRELLGRVVSIERNGRSVTPSRKLSTASRSVAALVRHTPGAARVAIAMREVLQSL
jgi:signal peptidase I